MLFFIFNSSIEFVLKFKGTYEKICKIFQEVLLLLNIRYCCQFSFSLYVFVVEIVVTFWRTFRMFFFSYGSIEMSCGLVGFIYFVVGRAIFFCVSIWCDWFWRKLLCHAPAAVLGCKMYCRPFVKMNLKFLNSQILEWHLKLFLNQFLLSPYHFVFINLISKYPE